MGDTEATAPASVPSTAAPKATAAGDGATTTPKAATAPLPPGVPPTTLPPLFAPAPTGLPGALPSLPDALNAVATADPGAARQVANGVLPQPTQTMGAAVLFFLSALRGGDLRGWMGERAVRALDAAGPSNAGRALSAEFTAASRQMVETPAGEWRQVGIPVLADGQVTEVRLATRYQRDGDDEAGDDAQSGEGHRFVLDLETTRFGPMQLDGLIKDQAIRLTIRTGSGLPPAIRQGIGEVFRTACDGVDHTGTLGFQTGAESWLQLARGQGGRLRLSRPVP